MKFNRKSPLVVLCIFLSFLALFSSCSKDSDLLADYVAIDPEVSIALYVRNDTFKIDIVSGSESNESSNIESSNGGENTIVSITSNGIVNDSYETSSGNSIVLDVLANDTFKDLDNVSISEISQPENGEVIINSDNTLTYTPAVIEPMDETFTYTAEFVKEDGSVGKETGTVTITIIEGSNKMGELLAFPGAEGFGKYTTGGRGGSVYHVTNLNDTGIGSFRYGVESLKGARTIVFDVSGYINLTTPIKVRGGYGNLTIAGETSPDGIALRGSGIWIHDSNIIIRHIKVRPGKDAYNPSNISSSDPDYEPDDGIKIKAWAGTSVENIIIDHVTVTWAHDGIIDVGAASSAYASNITIQNSLLAENVDKQYGVLLLNSNKVSFYRNIIAFTSDRNIAISPKEGEGVEMVNNLVYCTDRSTWFRVGNVNDFIGNSFITGPRTRQYETFKMEAAFPEDTDPNAAGIYLNDNLDDGVNADNSYNDRAVGRIVQNPNYNTGLNIIQASQVENSLVDNVGATLFYDSTDIRIMNNIKNRTGNLISHEENVGGYPSIGNTSRDDNYDTDSDGMSDSWEISEYGDLSTNNNDDTDGDGYTNLETFLYYLTSK